MILRFMLRQNLKNLLKYNQIIIVCTLVVVGFVFGFFFPGIVQYRHTENTPSFSYGDNAETFFYRANDSVKHTKRTGAKSAIIAHHLLVSEKIAETFAQLGTGREKTVVLISPNHFDQGRSTIQTTTGVWNTPYGDLFVDVDAVTKLIDAVPSLQIESQTFEREHGISGLTPFVKKWFPYANFVPLVIHETAKPNEIKELAEQIQKQLPNAVVIASIDMSHNLPEHIQTFHDDVTLRTIEAGGCNCDLEIDANRVIQTLFAVDKLRGTQSWNLVHHGSSLAMHATDKFEENTSHILGYFKKGKPDTAPFFSMQFVGDVMLDRGVRAKIQEQGVSYPWKYVQRYLNGAHLSIVNLEGPIGTQETQATETPPFNFVFDPVSVLEMFSLMDVVSLANNHTDDLGTLVETETQAYLKFIGMQWFGSSHSSYPVYQIDEDGISLSIIGFHQFGTSVEELEQAIQTENDSGRFVIVFPHWGEEYIQEPQEHQRELAKRMITAGADLIIGSHPHVVQGIERIDGVPVIYSLGNFVFDQGFDQTNIGLMAGVLIKNGRVKIQLSPVSTLVGQPKPLSDEQALIFYKELAQLSSADLSGDITKGFIITSYE